jgi:hypothetical protein
VRRRFASLARSWFALAVAWTLAAGAIVLVQHQVLRSGADAPQVQLAEDAARRIADGSDPLSVLPTGGNVPIETSLAPWLAVYDGGGAPLASTGRYRDGAPMLPSGVSDFARVHAGHRLRWQPRAGVRQALVIVPLARGGFVVAGRSLREVEAQKRRVLELVLVAWAVGLGALSVPALWLPSRNGS